jgi:hypothetical protein
MRLGSANIQNFPDMSPADVVADGKTMAGLTDIWTMQENEHGEDSVAIMRALGSAWGIAHEDTALPIFYRTSVMELIGTRRVISSFEPELPLTSRPRIITAAGFKIRRRPELKAFVVVNGHLIPGAYNGSQEDRRRTQWNIEFQDLRSFVADYKRKGRTVFVNADFNHPRPPKPVANFTWLVGEMLDRIGVTTTGGVAVDEIADGVVELHSDHQGQWTRVVLSND